MTHKDSNFFIKILLAFLVILLIILCVFLVRQYRIGEERKAISTERAHFANLVDNHSLNTADVDLIEPWMTFNYISISFKVPNSYFTTALDISTSTPHYPNITLGHYARLTATSSAVLTETIRSAVQNYLIGEGR